MAERPILHRSYETEQLVLQDVYLSYLQSVHAVTLLHRSGLFRSSVYEFNQCTPSKDCRTSRSRLPHSFGCGRRLSRLLPRTHLVLSRRNTNEIILHRDQLQLLSRLCPMPPDHLLSRTADTDARPMRHHTTVSPPAETPSDARESSSSTSTRQSTLENAAHLRGVQHRLFRSVHHHTIPSSLPDSGCVESVQHVGAIAHSLGQR